MGRFVKILVAFDGSESSVNALRQAMALAEKEHSWIKVVAVVPTFEGDLELVGVRDVEGVITGQVSDLVNSAKQIAGPDVPNLITNIEHGEAYEKILEVAEKDNCDLIVMGRRGLRRLERMLMGSVTARVVAHARADVLVVPHDNVVDLDHIILATDGSAHSEAALQRALYFADTYGKSLTALAVVDMLPEYYADATDLMDKRDREGLAVLARVKQTAADAGVEISTELLHGDPAEEITAYARKDGTGMIFVGSRGRSGLKKMLLGSVAEKIIGLADGPVFVAKTG
ncbi:MAG: universal stress protein [Thermoleophilia bacterium]